MEITLPIDEKTLQRKSANINLFFVIHPHSLKEFCEKIMRVANGENGGRSDTADRRWLFVSLLFVLIALVWNVLEFLISGKLDTDLLIGLAAWIFVLIINFAIYKRRKGVF